VLHSGDLLNLLFWATWIVLQCVVVSCSATDIRSVCCSVLQCVAVCCSVLQCVAVCCSVLNMQSWATWIVLQSVVVCCSVQCVAVCCSVLQCVAVCCGVLQRDRYAIDIEQKFKVSRISKLLEKKNCRLGRPGFCCSVWRYVAVGCSGSRKHNGSVLQCVEVCCSVLQCVAVCCSLLQCDAVC